MESSNGFISLLVHNRMSVSLYTLLKAGLTSFQEAASKCMCITHTLSAEPILVLGTSVRRKKECPAAGFSFPDLTLREK